MIEGLKFIKKTQSTERFDSYQAEYKGKTVFAKQAKNDKTIELLSGVPKNSEIVNKLGKSSKLINFRAPEVYLCDNDWLITEWIDGEPLSTRLLKEPDQIARILAEIMVVFDEQKIKPHGFRQIFTAKALRRRVDERVPKNLSSEQKAIVSEAVNRFVELHATLVPGLQDADMKPEHFFLDSNSAGRFVLIDSEHLSEQWPRFYDLGNNVAKFWIRNNKDFSVKLVEEFIKQSSVEEKTLFYPLAAILIVRGLSLHWEQDYDPGAENYNIPRAQKMLEDCIAARNLKNLLY